MIMRLRSLLSTRGIIRAMHGDLPTRPSLLVRIRDLKDADAWGQFVALYEPVIHRFLRRRGLADADAADLAQETLAQIAKVIERFEYNPQRGRFRGWLLTIARRQLAQFHERSARPGAQKGTGQTDVIDMLAAVPDDDEARQWERDCEQQALDWGMRHVEREFQPTTWRAFYATAVEQKPPQAVAEELGLTPNAVYTAKSRVTARLRQVMAELDA
jgi:RNA polymerase sigma-70 factor (ECF subfamily)